MPLLDYSQAIRLAPKNASLYSERAKIRIAAGDALAALPDLNFAVYLAPQSSIFIRDRAILKFNIQDLHGAIDDATEGIQLNPKDISNYVTRGQASTTISRTSIDDLNKAIEMNPNRAVLYSLRGIAYYWWSEEAKAQQDFDLALKMDPSLQGNIDFTSEFARQNRPRIRPKPANP